VICSAVVEIKKQQVTNYRHACTLSVQANNKAASRTATDYG